MKKRILTLLAVLALMVTCMVFAVSASDTAADREPAAPTVTLAGTEVCPVCSATLAEITAGAKANGDTVTGWTEVTADAITAGTVDWTAEHIWIKENITLPGANLWANNSQVILIRANTDFSAVPETSVTVTTTSGMISKDDSVSKLSIFGDKATIQSSLAAVSGGMFKFTNKAGGLVIKGGVTLKTCGTVTAATEGGFVYLSKAQGSSFEGVTFDGGKAKNGGAVCVGSTATDTIFKNCVFKNCTTTEKGGALMAYGSVTTMTDCKIWNCSTGEYGGAIYTYGTNWTDSGTKKVATATVNLTNSTVSDCSATTAGGVAYLNAGYLKLDNTPVSYCSSKAAGAFFTNIQTNGTAYGYARLEVLNDSHISNCSATAGSGGAIYVNKNHESTDKCVKVTDSNITNCTASSGGGGAIYIANTSKAYVFVGGDSVISGCTATSNGGAVLVNNGRFELMGTAQIQVASGGGNSKGVRIVGGWMRVRDTAKIISTGTGTGNGIYAVNVNGSATSPVYVILAQSGSVVGPDNSKYDGNIYVGEHTDGKYSQLRIHHDSTKDTSKWTGEASVRICTSSGTSYSATDVTLTHGELVPAPTSNGNKLVWVVKYTTAWVDATDEAAASFTGTLFAENETAGVPRLAGELGDLRVYRTQLDVNGTKTWHKTNADAVTAFAALSDDAKETAYLRPWTTEALEIGDNAMHVNFGKGVPATITVGDNGQLKAIDTTTSLGGKKTIPTSDVANAGYYEFGTRRYVIVANDNDTADIYPIKLEISHVNLRPSAERASLYYTADFSKVHADLMDDVTAGVAVTLKPDAAFDSLKDYIFTTAPTQGKYTGALLDGIIINKDGKKTAARATTEIYARAYIQLGGDVIMSDDVNWNLLRVVNAVTDLYNAGELDDPQKASFDSLYDWCKNIDVTTIDAEYAWTRKNETV